MIAFVKGLLLGIGFVLTVSDVCSALHQIARVTHLVAVSVQE
jgi:hypothetical protein